MLKKDIRTHFNKQRLDLSEQKINEFSVQIHQLLVNNFDLSGKNISIFLPIERFNEINTWEIINGAPNESYILPVIKEDDLIHIKYESKDQLEISDWGIPEPVRGEQIDPKEIDIVLVPMLACDMKGNRVGYGKGFYDGFLRECRDDCISVGLNFFAPIDEITDVHDGDIPLNFLVTPDKVFSFT